MDRFRTAKILLICVALLATRIGGAHLHLCFDGQEPSASVHFADDGDAAKHTQAGPVHQDVTLDLNSAALAKQPKIDLPLLALIFSVALALVGGGRTAVATIYKPRFSLTRLPRLRPPLRGPPLNSVV